MTVLVIPDGTTEIKEWEYFKSEITEVMIPNSVKTIKQGAFGRCLNIQTVVLPDSVTTVGWCAFQGCSSLKTLILPVGVTTIGQGAFYGCSSLQTATIPVSVVELQYNVFDKCTNLERMWNKTSYNLYDCDPWVHLRGETPPLKELEKWAFALHWHWKNSGRITPEQARLFTVGLHCLAVPIELCQTVFSYIPRACL
jgi:hypothetical protein